MKSELLHFFLVQHICKNSLPPQPHGVPLSVCGAGSVPVIHSHYDTLQVHLPSISVFDNLLQIRYSIRFLKTLYIGALHHLLQSKQKIFTRIASVRLAGELAKVCFSYYEISMQLFFLVNDATSSKRMHPPDTSE